MREVVLFTIYTRGGFKKTVTARIRRGALEVSSYAFDTDGYDHEHDFRVDRSDVPSLRAALGLNRLQRYWLLPTLRSRFSKLNADTDLARFLKDEGIPTTGSSYGKFP